MANANGVKSSLKGHVEVAGKKGMSRRMNSVPGANNFGRRDTGKMNS
jgi:hypothetical protein